MPTRSHGWRGRSWFAASDTPNRSCCWQSEYTNWRGHDDVMQKRSFRGSGEPAWVSAPLSACLRLGPDPRRALGPAATPAATAYGPSRHFPALQNLVAIGAIADMVALVAGPIWSRMTQLRHRVSGWLAPFVLLLGRRHTDGTSVRRSIRFWT